jgi:hypothetical protein
MPLALALALPGHGPIAPPCSLAPRLGYFRDGPPSVLCLVLYTHALFSLTHLSWLMGLFTPNQKTAPPLISIRYQSVLAVGSRHWGWARHLVWADWGVTRGRGKVLKVWRSG